ncbi:MAG TPA: transposase [Bacteroidales bacterium]|jgi:REP element-mobilizing transposase RayT|nr:transposase [Bacteroidales bacterium]
MSPFVQRHHRGGSPRLDNHDYSGNFTYYITICTKAKIPYFGRIVSDNVCFSSIGIIADNFWKSIPEHFSFVKLDEYIIMPDHIHGILIFNKPNLPVDTPNIGASASSNWKPGSLATIINSYKRICTITIKNQGFDFAWQNRYYDHIVKSKTELDRIRKYIRDNPINYNP